MSRLVLNSESLNKVLEGKEISKDDAYQIYKISTDDPSALFQAAQILRNKNHSNIVTFSKKAFFNIVNLCRDTCSYCTYKAEPNESKLSMMTKSEVLQLSKLAKKHN